MELSSNNLFVKNWKLLANVAITAAALAGVIAMQWTQLDRAGQKAANPKQAEQEEALRLQMLKRLPTLGFDNLIADWAFINFLQYFGDDEARAQTGYSLSADYFDLITQRDPRFAEVYPYLSSSVSFYLGQPKLAVQYMNRGTKVLSPKLNSTAFLVWRFKGLDQLLLMGDIPGAIQSHEKAAEWVLGTPYSSLAPLYRNTAEFLRQDPDSIDVRFRSWAEVYSQAVDKRVQQRAEQEIYKLGGQIKRNEKGEVSFIPPKKKPSKSK
ncbi:MAG: hypothetical protein KME19_18470 [Microcoleus vaginatus WJT46-NPBG5]|nr:hypothetical protein [Microcoleus vaginatus WJT46-NPBG5]